MAVEPQYEVVCPTGEAIAADGAANCAASAAPLADLGGKRIGLIWTTFSNGNLLLEALADLLSRRFAGLQAIKVAPGRNLSWGDYPDETLTDLVRAERLDGAIVTAAC